MSEQPVSRLRVPLLSAALAVLSAGLLLGAAPRAPLEAAALPVALVLLAAFALAEALVIHVDIGDNAHSASLIEVPMVLALFWLPVHLVVLTRVVGALLTLWLHRRQSLSKMTFNVCMMALEATVAALVFTALAPEGGVSSVLSAWSAVVAACLASSVTSSSAVMLVIAASTGRPVAWSSLRGIALFAGPATLVSSTLAFLAVHAVHAHAAAAAPVLLIAVTGTAGYLQYVRLHKRHERLASLYGFVHEVSASASEAGPVRAVLTQTRLRLNSDVVVLTQMLAPDAHDDSLVVLRHELDVDGGLVSVEHRLSTAEWPVARCLTDQRSVLAPRGTADPALQAFLRREGVRDGILAAVPGQNGSPGGTLFVGGRRGEHSTFERADVTALEGLAGHAAVALHNGTLLEQLTYESRHDLLTALPNRTEFQARLTAALTVSEGPTAILFMDLDRFKDVNDTLGHHAGDRLLETVALRLVATAPTRATVARLGGDEFAVVLPGCDVEGATTLALRIRAALQVPVELDALSVDVGVSIGVAVHPQHGSDVHVLMRHADIAMYDAKERDGIATYDGQRDEPSSSRLALVAQLREGLATDQLLLHYQPQVASEDGRIVRFEALLRWQHPTRGLVPPDEFIPVAERAGLLQEITRWVIARALDDLLGWRLAGADVGISVNLSPRNLLDPALAQQVRDELRQRRLPPGCLTLEITEATLMRDPESALQTLRQLHETGVRLSVDDFGTGYSSLAYLKHLPVDEVKVDRSFVKDLAEDPTDLAIVRAVVALAGSLRLEVVAEGVEDAASQAVLITLGCSYLQGFHLGRPVPQEQVMALLALQKPWPGARPALTALPVPRRAADGASA
jgi:diguanylate cyclase (GGDEF)-like protein